VRPTYDHRAPADLDDVKNDMLAAFARVVDWIFAVPGSASMRDLESEVWRGILVLGGMLLSAALARRCREATLADVAQRGVADGQWRLRLDDDYRVTVATTFGRVRVPMFAWRDRSGEREVTRTPAVDSVLPLHPRCRSSELLLEWECRAGAEAPYRRAAETLGFYSHGAVDLEDTTIADHLGKVAPLVDRSWQYRRPAEIAAILRDRATRARGGRPILYASTDACALRRYVDETTAAAFKMANGIRLWCTDKRTGETIHLGGEYTWGDCGEVQAAFADLDDMGVLPSDGVYGDLPVRIVVTTDGQPWIHDRIVPMFPGAVAILDPWHLIERFATDAKGMFGESTKRAASFLKYAVAVVLGKTERSSPTPKNRRGRRNQRRAEARPLPAGACPKDDGPDRILGHVRTMKVPRGAEDVRKRLVTFLENNLDRMRYRVFRWQGFLLGSGAMESLHRTAVQCRIKLPGCRWLPETSAGIMKVRMMAAAGRWDEFWAQPGLTQRLVVAFEPKAAGHA
jgi:hypothetical protein